METGTWLLIIRHSVSLCIAIYFSAPDYADNSPLPSSFSFFYFSFLTFHSIESGNVNIISIIKKKLRNRYYGLDFDF